MGARFAHCVFAALSAVGAVAALLAVEVALVARMIAGGESAASVMSLICRHTWLPYLRQGCRADLPNLRLWYDGPEPATRPS